MFEMSSFCCTHVCPLQEIKELESQVQNETVVLRDNSKRSLDMDEIVESVKNQYANMAARTRDEAERWNQKKVRKGKIITREEDTVLP